jgi:hypothetical protein
MYDVSEFYENRETDEIIASMQCLLANKKPQTDGMGFLYSGVTDYLRSSTLTKSRDVSPV